MNNNLIELIDLVMDDPQLRKSVKIRFSSLRNGVGMNLGVIHDIDTDVERDCYRVKTEKGWKWRIKGLRNLMKYDPFAEVDQEILDEYGDKLEFEIVFLK